jgi:hypothetical protein
VRASWTAVPSTTDPRLLVPAGAGRLAAAAVRRQLTGTRWRTRGARAVLGAALATGLPGRLPGQRIEVVGPPEAPTIEDPLCDVLGEQRLRLTMPIGPARANRKPVLQVTAPDGRVLAFAKVAHDDLTGRLVRGEAAALAEVGAASPREVRAPRVLGLVEWTGRDVLVLEVLDIPSRRLTGGAARRRLLAVVDEVAGVGGRRDLRWGEHPYRQVLLGRSRACGPVGAAVRRVVGAVDETAVLPTGAWHGDLNPGNLALVPGVSPVWDWERFELGVPVGFDLLHHDLQRMITVDGVPAAEAATRLVATAADVLAPLGVARVVAAGVARLHLATLACRYTADDQAGAGAHLGHVDTWLLPALEEVTP